jgi:prepilin-type N-terminal cleavage/methylation domain-containing protein
MKVGGPQKGLRRAGGIKPCSNRGFTLIEMMLVVAIIFTVATISLPVINKVMATYRLRSAVASITGAIQTTRYQAISSGYPFQLVLSTATSTYQVQSDPGLTGTFTNVGSAVPLANSSIPVTLGAATTLRFRPSGLVTAAVGSTTLTLTYGGKTETITVSNYGNIKVTP